MRDHRCRGLRWPGGCAALRDAKPSPVAATPAGIDAFATGELARRRIPGMALVVLRGPQAWLARGYGVEQDGEPEAVTPDTVFQLGSISKQFLAALVARLAEQKQVSLDAPVTRYLPRFRQLPPDVTLRHLLNHTSGIREPFLMPEYDAGILDLDRSAADWIAILEGAPVDFAAGARWSYSNANYMILALVVEAVTGVPYEQALADAFFVPLGLQSLRPCTPLPQRPGEARGHVLRPEGVRLAAPENVQWMRGDGGLCGSARDVARWMRLLATGTVVSAPTYRSMTTPTPVAHGPVADYGFGLSLVTLDGVRKVSHNGAMLGYSASAAHYPDADTTVVVLTNLGGVRTEAIERGVARRVLGVAQPDLRGRATDARERARLAGTYDLGVFKVEVAERDGRLWLQAPPPGPRTALRDVGHGEFAGDIDPDAVRVLFPDREGRSRMRLFMGGMHWYAAPPQDPADR